jgi:hypothetical protein
MTETKTQTTLTKEIEHHFSLDELRNLGISLANAIADIETLTQEKVDFMADLKGRHKDAQAKVKLLAEKIRTGSEVRLVECRLEKDFLANAVRIYRLDTGELVEERPMTQEERQLHLNIPEPEAIGPRQVDLN